MIISCADYNDNNKTCSKPTKQRNEDKCASCPVREDKPKKMEPAPTSRPPEKNISLNTVDTSESDFSCDNVATCKLVEVL